MTGSQLITIVLSAAALAGGLTFLRQRLRRQQLAAGVELSPTFSERWWQALTDVWREDVRPNEKHKMQIVVGVACMGITLALGYGYANDIWIDGWQLWTWLLSLFILGAVIIPFAHLPPIHLPNRREIGLFIGWGLAIASLRLLFLESVPGGLHVDEMGMADFSVRHVYPGTGRTINPFITGFSSQPALFHYLIRISFTLFGYTITGLRIINGLAGSLAIWATYALITQLSARRTALISAAIMTTYHYHIHWSRLGLNNIWDTLWVPLTLAVFIWGWRRDWSGGGVIAGFAVGLSQYFYSGNKVGILLLVYLLYYLYRRKPDKRKLFIHGGKLLVTAVAVASPIALFALIKPDEYFLRARTVWGWSGEYMVQAIGEVDGWRFLGHQLWRNLGAFTAVPEVTGFYGPGVPFLIGVAAPLFVIGLFWAVWKRQFMPVLWVLLTVFLGGILLSGAPSSSHYVVIIPAICWLTAVPLNFLWENGHWRIGLILLLAIMATDLFFYFGVFVPSGPRDLFNAMPAWPLN